MKLLGEPSRVYYDISPEISEGSAVFPGDVSFRRLVSLDFRKGDHLGLSSIQTTVHIGAHADAPSHYHSQGQSIDQRPLERYFGSCQVVSVQARPGQRVTPGDVKVKIEAPRILFKTSSFPYGERWREDFNSLSPELIARLADQGVVLVGIDTPSIDPHDSKELESHLELYRRDMAVLEGLVLGGVEDGLYDLIALPLKIRGADASPVRAILVERAK